MISVTGVTGKYILQPGLITMHQESLNWISSTMLWKRELSFFQKLLDQHAPKSTAVGFKKQIDHFQCIITYYQGEIVDLLRKKLREHETRLANMLKELNEADVVYFKEHRAVIDELSSFQEAFGNFKQQYFEFIEHEPIQ